MEYKPHNYQAYCIERIVNDEAVGLFLRPGLGKTSITLSAINILKYYRWSICKALVIAPKKVAEGTWSKEAAKWDHLQHLRVVPVLGSSAKRIRALNTPADVYVINRENTAWLVDYYKQDWPFDMVVLDAKAQKAYRDFEKNLLLEINEDVITANTAAVLTGKLQQFCAGAMYDDDRRVVHIHDAKLEAYLELIESLNGEPCITFYGYQHDRDRILAALEKTKLRVRVYRGTEDEDEWNAGGIDVLLVHPSSCAYGLNLQAGGRHIVWFTPNWSFELNDQGKCRLWRQGSPYDKVYVHYLVVQGGVDEDVMAAIRDRAATHDTVMRVLKARIQKVKAER